MGLGGGDSPGQSLEVILHTPQPPRLLCDATGGVAGSAETGERLAAVVAVRPHLIFEGTAA